MNPDGSVKKVAESKDVKANNAKSRLGCTVSSKFSSQFAAAVSWQKVDQNGNEVEEEDDITQGNGNVEGGEDNGNDGPPPEGGGFGG